MFCGTWQLPPCNAANMVWPWLANAQKAAPCGWLGSASTSAWPAAMLVPPPARAIAGEGLHIQVRALGAGLDELRGKGEDRARSKGCVEGVGDWNCLGCGSDESLMAGFNSDDLGCSSENSGGFDERSSSEIAKRMTVSSWSIWEFLLKARVR